MRIFRSQRVVLWGSTRSPQFGGRQDLFLARCELRDEANRRLSELLRFAVSTQARAAMRTAAQFEQGMARLQATLSTPPEQLARLREAFDRLERSR